MENQEARDGLAVFSSAYVKRWLEGHFYDKLFQTEVGEKLKALDNKAKYGIEFGLNLLTVFFDQRLSEDTFLKRLVKQVGLDTSPEISKRLINNTKDHLKKVATSPQERELVDTLLGLEDETLIRILNWLYDIEATERAQIFKQMTQLSPEELLKLAELPPEDMGRLLGLLTPQAEPKKKRSVLSTETIEKIEGATARIEDMRRTRRERRKGR